MAGKKRFSLRFVRNNHKLFLRFRGKLDGSGACHMEHALDRPRALLKPEQQNEEQEIAPKCY